MSRSTALCRLLRRRGTIPRYSTHSLVPSPPLPNPIFASQITKNYSTSPSRRNSTSNARPSKIDRLFEEFTAKVESERRRKREEMINADVDVSNVDENEEPDFVGPILAKLEREVAKYKASEMRMRVVPTDSDSESEDDEQLKMREEIFEKKFNHHQKLLNNFAKAENFDDAFKWMKMIDDFEEKHLQLKPEYRVIGELMNRLKVAEGKEKFLLQVKLNRALRLAEARDAFDPNDPSNYGVLELQDVASAADRVDDSDSEEDETKKSEEIDGLVFDSLKQKDNKYLDKLNEIDKELEEKLAELDYTFGKKGKLLEEKIRDLAEERNYIIEQKRQPLYRRGFHVRLVDMNRTCKVTKGGQVVKYTAMMACGNFKGVIGFAKAKAPAVPLALQKAREKCFQNLHYVERHEDHTIAHAIQTSYKKTKLYLWPAPTTTGMKAGRTVELILDLAGYKNVKSKVIGSRNPHNVVKAVFKALNAIETPRDVQEKFGRTVVESYLL